MGETNRQTKSHNAQGLQYEKSMSASAINQHLQSGIMTTLNLIHNYVVSYDDTDGMYEGDLDLNQPRQVDGLNQHTRKKNESKTYGVMHDYKSQGANPKYYSLNSHILGPGSLDLDTKSNNSKNTKKETKLIMMNGQRSQESQSIRKTDRSAKRSKTRRVNGNRDGGYQEQSGSELEQNMQGQAMDHELMNKISLIEQKVSQNTRSSPKHPKPKRSKHIWFEPSLLSHNLSKQIKYLGLCIEKDEEYDIEEDDLQMMRKQKLDGKIHQYLAQELECFESQPADPIKHQYIPIRDHYVRLVKRCRKLFVQSFDKRGVTEYKKNSKKLFHVVKRLRYQKLIQAQANEKSRNDNHGRLKVNESHEDHH